MSHSKWRGSLLIYGRQKTRDSLEVSMKEDAQLTIPRAQYCQADRTAITVGQP
ncbi:MAG: hypothetical protein H0X47_00360 [Nitrospirales bacterium]|nr:hypothetical protein [Nitrospirales bacterium]